MRYIRIRDLLKKLQCSRATLYRRLEEGVIPPPFYLGRTPMWDEREVDEAILALRHQGNPPTTASA